ncbi:MAG TPA: hypothetical protein VH619_08990 [Verrucomicrobiae bacterium]|nr:hypothetical protein [Verrucomicrobiae bacterium]
MNPHDDSGIIQLRRVLAERFPHVRTWSRLPPPKIPPIRPTGLHHLDSLLQGGLSESSITEFVSPGSGAGSALLLRALLWQTRQTAQFMGLIDGADSFDPTGLPPSILSRLFWVRCKTAEEAMKATDILLRDRNLSLIVLDLKMNPAAQLRKISGTTWYRLQRIARQSATAFVAVTPHPMVPSAETRIVLENRFTLDALSQDESRLLAELKFDLTRAPGEEAQEVAG